MSCYVLIKKSIALVVKDNNDLKLLGNQTPSKPNEMTLIRNSINGIEAILELTKDPIIKEIDLPFAVTYFQILTHEEIHTYINTNKINWELNEE